MPTHRSEKKRIKTSEKRNLRNRAAKSRVKVALRKVSSASDKSSAEDALKKAYSVLDKAVQAGILHRNKAAHKKAQAARAVQAVRT
jgi:small subunit ribosomal protein S20